MEKTATQTITEYWQKVAQGLDTSFLQDMETKKPAPKKPAPTGGAPNAPTLPDRKKFVPKVPYRG